MWSATTAKADVAWRTGSLEQAVNEHPADVWACTDKELLSGQDTYARFVDCRRPHLFEATGNLIVLEGMDSYPTTRARAAEEVPCRRSLTSQQRQDGLAVRTVWASPAQLRDGGDGVLVGWCWRFRTDGAPLPPMT
jgi:hypothetical protein